MPRSTAHQLGRAVGGVRLSNEFPSFFRKSKARSQQIYHFFANPLTPARNSVELAMPCSSSSRQTRFGEKTNSGTHCRREGTSDQIVTTVVSGDSRLRRSKAKSGEAPKIIVARYDTDTTR
jgi:hypothetical protein